MGAVHAADLDSLTELADTDSVLVSRDGVTLTKSSVSVVLGRVSASFESRFESNENNIEAALAQIGQVSQASTNGLNAQAQVSAAIAARVTTVEQGQSSLSGTFTAFQSSAQNSLNVLSTTTATQAQQIVDLNSTTTAHTTRLDGLTQTTSNLAAQATQNLQTLTNADNVEAAARLALAGRMTTAEGNITGLQDNFASLGSTVTNNYNVLVAAGQTEANARLALASDLSTAQSNIIGLQNNYAALNSTVINNYNTLSAANTTEANARLALASTVTTINNSKAQVFYQTSNPPTSGRVVGDTWYDSDDGNRPYVWTGSAWADNSDGRFNNLFNAYSTLSASVINNYNTLAAVDTAEANTREAVRVSLQNQIDTANGSISVEASARLAAINGLQSQLNLTYAVDFDTGDGVAKGFKIVGTGARVDAKWLVSYFAIQGPDGNAFVPFSVDTVNNRVNMSNVYVQNLYADCVSANNLKSNAATAIAIVTKGVTYGTGAYQTLCTGSITLPIAGYVVADAIIQQGFHSGNGWSWGGQLTVNGASTAGSAATGTVQNTSLAVKNAQYLAAGTYPVSLTWKGDSGGVMSADSALLFVQAFPKTT